MKVKKVEKKAQDITSEAKNGVCVVTHYAYMGTITAGDLHESEPLKTKIFDVKADLDVLRAMVTLGDLEDLNRQRIQDTKNKARMEMADALEDPAIAALKSQMRDLRERIKAAKK